MIGVRGWPAAGGRVACTAALHAAADFLLPLACVCCERLVSDGDTGLVCGRCWSRLAAIGAPRCERCGHPVGRHRCHWCDLLPPYVRAVRSVCWVHRGTGSGIVHALKYGAWPGAADGMADRMARLAWPADVVAERSALLPVPLAASRARERGFNQSERLARPLARRLGMEVWDDLLERARSTTSQTRLTPAERRRNVSGAFAVVPGAASRLRGAHLVLVDDVVTTASTLNACAEALFTAGARIVSYVTFGRAPALGDPA